MSTRLITDTSGNVAKRYDYLPFGEEIPAGVGGRTTAMGYTTAGDGFGIKFTGQYRDLETNLDYSNARYYSPQQGRFVSPDPGNAGADPAVSTSWNGYGYVGNNPLNATDPSGEGFWSNLAGFFASLFGGWGISNFGVNSGPWNEQVPGGGDFGRVGEYW